VIRINTSGFDPKSIVLKDDACHKAKFFGTVETWYYDAIFDNNYSVVCLVNVIKFLKTGMILTGLFIYKDTTLITSSRERTFLRDFQGSTERPYLVIKNKEIINGDVHRETKDWAYHIVMGDKKNNVNLRLIKQMEPWSGNHFLGNWLVIPRLEVKGNVTVDGEEITVEGHGYHDHNNYPLFAPFFSKGANFGKISAGPINVVWAQVMGNKNAIENIVVINKDDAFQSIPSKDIRLSVEDSIKEHGKIVPTKYLLNIDKKEIYMNVEIESLNYHYVTIPSVKYWRHHARNTGEIRYQSLSKKIHDVSIIDQLSFL
jgi:hypothetical protein